MRRRRCNHAAELGKRLEPLQYGLGKWSRYGERRVRRNYAAGRQRRRLGGAETAPLRIEKSSVIEVADSESIFLQNRFGYGVQILEAAC